MKVEWLAFCAVTVAGLSPLLFRRIRSNGRTFTVAGMAVVGAVLGAKGWEAKQSDGAKATTTFLKTAPHQGRSGGYVSSDKCQSCHPGQYESWHRSFHRTMTQVANPATVLGDFNNVTLSLDGEPIVFQRRGDEFWVEMIDPDWKHDFVKAQVRGTPFPAANHPPRTWKRITLLTGSHHMQAFWVPSYRGNVQFGAPFVWLIHDRRWAPRKDTFIRDPQAPSPIQIWNLNCIQCHATAGQPREHPTTKVLDSRVGEFGIACESCHGPAQDHARANLNPLRRYRLHRGEAGDRTIVNPTRAPAKVSAQICGQCHGIKWNLHREQWLEAGFRYRPGGDLLEETPLIRPTQLASQSWLPDALRHDPALLQNFFWPDGMVRVTGREYNGLIETPCHIRGELSCVSCHSMHRYHAGDDQLASGMDGNRACLQCHRKYESQLQEHTRHVTGSPGSLCYNCHMPHTTYGL